MGLLRCSITALCIAASMPAAGQLPDEGVIEALRAGGITIYFRHGQTDKSQADQRGAAPTDCAKQRNLGEEGRAEAAAIGAALRAMSLEFEDEVPASPYCRTMDTARLIMGRATPTPAILGKRSAEGKVVHEELTRLLMNPPPKPRIRVVVAHGNQLMEAAPLDVPGEIAEGEAAIFRGDGKSWVLLARVPARDWPRLAALAGKR